MLMRGGLCSSPIRCEACPSWAAGWERSESGRQAGETDPGSPPRKLSQRSTGTSDPPPWQHTSSPRSPVETQRSN